MFLPSFPDFRRPRDLRRGVALVIVLSCLALLTVLAVAFLSNVSTELTSSAGFADGNDARQKSQLAVNLVMAQIQEATGTNPTATPSASDSPLAWASQPGMIRTYDTAGMDVMQYKLYSSDAMAVTGFQAVQADGTTANDVAADWYTKPSQYVDLNSPVKDLSGQLNYPILDPGAQITLASPAVTGPSPAPTPNTKGVNGLKIASNTPSGGATGNYAPMPVRWMYLLKDGSLRTASTADNKTIPDASAANPVVSRLAFWTDDDTCKVNINTAAGDLWNPPDITTPGSYSSIPLASNLSESTLKANQPVQHEYQRYPGHPATTYLSAVFPNLGIAPSTLGRAEIFNLAPKISPENAGPTPAATPIYSQGGTVSTLGSKTLAGAGQSLPLAKKSHLYASVDELRFRVTADPSSTVRAANNPTASTNVTPLQVEQARFFLTAHSRAPEVNLFNKPRVSIWPEDANPAYRTTFDNNIAFCSTVGTRPFYFVRDTDQKTDSSGLINTGNTSATLDVNLPQGSNPWANLDIYNYLHGLMYSQIPGFSGSFFDKYGSDSDQILTEIFDYIRCTNLCDVTNGTTAANSHPYASSISTSATTGSVRTLPPGEAHVVPAYFANNDTRGFGRSFTLYAPILMFYSVNSQIDPDDLKKFDKQTTPPVQPSPPATPIPTPVPNTPDGVIDTTDASPSNALVAKIYTKRIQAVLLLDTFSPSQGVVRMTPNLDFTVTGLEDMTLDGKALGFASSATATFEAMCYNNEYAWGGITSAANMFGYYDRTNKAQTPVPLSGDHSYQLFSKTIDVNSEYRQPLAFSGAQNVKVSIHARTRDGQQGDVIQTIALNFPSTSIPTPLTVNSLLNTGNSLSMEGKPNPVKYPGVGDYNFYQLHGGVTASPYAVGVYGGGAGGLANPNWQPYGFSASTADKYLFDVTRMLTPYHGDMRLVMGSASVDTDLSKTKKIFTPAPGLTIGTGHVAGSGYSDFNTPDPLWLKKTFLPASDYSRLVEYYSGGMTAGLPRGGTGGGKWSISGSLVPGAAYDAHTNDQDRTLGPAVQDDIAGAFLKDDSGATIMDNKGNPSLGDWDNGMGGVPDGPYINKPDEGELGPQAYSSYGGSDGSTNPTMTTASLFSPNRQISSPVMFGSLSTGVKKFKPWQTLLFCPNPAGKTYHPGFGTSRDIPVSVPPLGPLTKPPFSKPPDHLLLDLFTMPVVEPYAISEPFSTAGKINMNFQIVPFTYIERSTGMQAVLASLRVGAIPTGDAYGYKGLPSKPPAGVTAPSTATYRFPLNIDDTLAAFRARFNKNEIFRSASQICEMPFIPLGAGLPPNHNRGTSVDLQYLYSNFWDNNKLTGDNLREQPYSYAYSRLTTKSNSYTVHVWVQTLKKSPRSLPNGWDESIDQITGEYRGSYEIERFLDPNITSYDPTIPLTAYKFRTIGTKQFTP